MSTKSVAHRQQGVRNGVSSDRLVGGPCGSVAVAEDEEVAELCFLVEPSVVKADMTEGNGDAELFAELGPPGEVVVVGTVVVDCVRSQCEVSKQVNCVTRPLCFCPFFVSRRSRFDAFRDGSSFFISSKNDTVPGRIFFCLPQNLSS